MSDKKVDTKHEKLDTSMVKPYEACGEAPFSKNMREGKQINTKEIEEIRNRLNSGDIHAEDVAFLDGLLSKTLRGLRAFSDHKIYETLPNGMDIIK